MIVRTLTMADVTAVLSGGEALGAPLCPLCQVVVDLKVRRTVPRAVPQTTNNPKQADGFHCTACGAQGTALNYARALHPEGGPALRAALEDQVRSRVQRDEA